MPTNRARLLLLAFPLFAAILAGCCSFPEPAPGRARVYLITGSLPPPGGGFNGLAEKLRARGMAVEHANRWDRWRIADKLIEQARAGAHDSPIVLIGHSGGGRDAIFIARRLQTAGVPVDCLICIDTAWADPLPANVLRAAHFYLGRGPDGYPARPLVYEPGVEREVHNVNLLDALAPDDRAWLNHLNVDDRAAVQQLVVEEVTSVMGPHDTRGPPPAQ